MGISEEVAFREEVHRLASEGAVMNVHELLDIKQEAKVAVVDIYDHFRRVGLHRYASIFEHFGIRRKQDIDSSLAARCEAWEADFKVDVPHRQRLKKLLSGDNSLDTAYDLADLSVLRDRFLSAYQKSEPAAKAPARLRPAQPLLSRSASEPSNPQEPMQRRQAILRQTSGKVGDESLKLLEMAHLFQESLENDGKTDISMFQLDMHLERFADDPAGALENCTRLRLPSAQRSPQEREVVWTTTFAFLRRIGLEQYAFQLEDNGYQMWNELKALGLDELKEKGEMSKEDATICHAVLSAKEDRPDLLRKFQIPEFRDIIAFFQARFPEAKASQARSFAQSLTDELGVSDFSCHQINAYLANAKGPVEAIARLEEGLPSLKKAQAARKRPDASPPAAPPTCWVYTWLKSKDLEAHAPPLMGQGLETREDILDAPLDHEALTKIGIQKIGDRCKLLRYIEAERAASGSAEVTSMQ